MAASRCIRCYLYVSLFFIKGAFTLENQSSTSLIPIANSDLRQLSDVHLSPTASEATNNVLNEVSASHASKKLTISGNHDQVIHHSSSSKYEKSKIIHWTTGSSRATGIWTRSSGITEIQTSRTPGTTRIWPTRTPGTTKIWTTESPGTDRPELTIDLGTAKNVNNSALVNETKADINDALQHAPLVLDLEAGNGEMKQHSGGAIVGVIAGILVAVIIVAVVFLNVRDKKRKIIAEDRQHFFTEMI